MKIDRLIGILSILLQRDKVTAAELAEKFEVSVRTINRDIETLCMAGIPLVTARGADGGISVMDGYKIDRTLLTASEMRAVLSGLKSLDSVSETNRYAQLMEKLSAGSSKLLAGDSNILIDLSSWYKETISQQIELIHAAIEQKCKITFMYYSPNKERLRTVEPYKLIFQWSGWYLWGFCEYRQEFRLFKLTRMVGLSVGEHFAERPVVLPDLARDKVFPQCIRVKAVFDEKHKWRLIEEFGVGSFWELPDKRLMFEFGFTDKETIVKWMASFGDGAKLLEPEEYREDIIKFAEAIRRNYDV